ncbi:MAG: ribonuclease III domain-containing protein [Clostridiales bacterium]
MTDALNKSLFDNIGPLKANMGSSVGDPRILPVLTLAYVGDAVFELMVRQHFLAQGFLKSGQLHKKAISLVCAKRQSLLANHVEKLLTDEELNIYKRGRNAKSGHQPPNVPVTDYRRATGIEALVGFLYLKKDEQRLVWLFDVLFEDMADC